METKTKANRDVRRRKLKITRAFGNHLRPSLHLQGLWLARAGFVIGMRVPVKVEMGCLTITLLKESEKGGEKQED